MVNSWRSRSTTGCTIFNSDIGVTLDNTCSHIGLGRIKIPLTATKDVTYFNIVTTRFTDGTTRDVYGCFLYYGTHLTATIDITFDDTARDVHLGCLRCCQQWPMLSIERSTVNFGKTSHRAAEHISTMFVLYIATDSTTIDVHSDMSTALGIEGRSSFWTWIRIRAVVLIIFPHLAIRLYTTDFFIYQVETIAHRGQSTTAIDRAKHCATIDNQINRTAYITGSQRLATESTATTEHVTINVCRTDRTNLRTSAISLTNGNRRVSQYVTILTTAEYRTIDSTAFNINNSIIHICFLVEVNTLVTLTGTKEVTGNRVILYLLRCTRHTERAARHGDFCCTQHIGGLTTTIDVGQNVATADLHVGVAFNRSCTIEVFTDTLCGIKIRHTT